MILVRFTKTAQADLTDAFQWCESKRERLGYEFMERVDQVVDQIARHPLSCPKTVEDARRANLEQFPYALYYKTTGPCG